MKTKMIENTSCKKTEEKEMNNIRKERNQISSSKRKGEITMKKNNINTIKKTNCKNMEEKKMKNNVMKRTIGFVMALMFIMGSAAAAFATGSEVQYNENTAIWSIYDHTTHPATSVLINNKPHYAASDGYAIDLPNGSSVLMDYINTDRNDGSKAEGIAVKALYVFQCPDCSTYTSGYEFKELKCTNCSNDCTGEKVYRFIVVPSDSEFYKSYSSVNMVAKTNSYFKDTAGNYGDGKDLPQSALKYEDGKLVGFSKTSVSIPNWRAFLQFILYPISVFLSWAANVNWGSVVISY